jgi:uncharacterized protein
MTSNDPVDVKIKNLEVVLKITERCNINCSYCYVFNQGDVSYKDHPALMSKDCIGAVARFVGEAARRHDIEHLKIDFHGGEPMLIGSRRYLEACDAIRSAVPSSCAVRFVIQTNATFIDGKWIDAFAQTGTVVGVSLDGPKELNDRLRVDHHGRGTYDRTVTGLRLLQQASSRFSNLQPPAIICVIDPRSNAESVFEHFRQKLGVSSIHYLLPDVSHLSVERPNYVLLSKYFRDLLTSWLPFRSSVRVRFLDFIFAVFDLGARGILRAEAARDESVVVTIASNGELGPNDSWRTVAPAAFSTGMTAASTELREFLRDSRVSQFVESARHLATECQHCCWQRICHSGNLFESVHRFGGARKFDRSSVYCQSIQSLLTDATEEALKVGIPFRRIEQTLASSYEESV